MKILKILASFLVVGFSLLFSIRPLLAQGDLNLQQLFTVSGIEIDETAQNATIAKRNGLAKAENVAFQKLLEKLLLSQDLSRFQMPEYDQVSNYVLGVEVEKERNSRVRYIGKVNITFSPEKIETLLGSQNIPFVGFTRDPMMVFPIFLDAGSPLLWEEGNIFLSTWRKISNDNGLLVYRLPEGSLREKSSLGPDQILTGSQERQLRLTLSEYGTAGYWAVTAKFNKSSNGEITDLTLTFSQPLEGFPEEVFTYGKQGEATREEMLSRAIRDFYNRQEQNWKAEALTQFGESRELPLMVPVSSPAVWADVKTRLETSPVISAIHLARIGSPETFIAITFSGTDEQLALALRQKGLILLRAGRGFALLRTEDAAAFLAERGDQ